MSRTDMLQNVSYAASRVCDSLVGGYVKCRKQNTNQSIAETACVNTRIKMLLKAYILQIFQQFMNLCSSICP
jgi:hypothetical protein